MEATTNQSSINILIVDDDPTFRDGLRASLKSMGYSADTARNAEEALAYVHERRVGLVLLDINMPGMGGVDACRRIRTAAPQAGIVMLTVRDTEDDRVLALEAGADDYVTKPFRLRELLARMRAVLRRTGGDGGAHPAVLRAGELELDVERRLLRKAGREIHLSPKEYDLLVFLMEHRNIPLTHARILRTLWGPEYGTEAEYLRTYIKNLRKKLEDNPGVPEYLVTEPWVGYRFRDPADPDAAPQVAEEDED
jgi:two-component system KDP operon response regulator KdpE